MKKIIIGISLTCSALFLTGCGSIGSIDQPTITTKESNTSKSPAQMSEKQETIPEHESYSEPQQDTYYEPDPEPYYGDPTSGDSYTGCHTSECLIELNRQGEEEAKQIWPNGRPAE